MPKQKVRVTFNQAAAAGIGYDQLCQKIIDMAFED